MSVKSVLRGCSNALAHSARVHREQECEFSALQCDLQAEAVLRLLADLDMEKEQQEETSDD